MKRLLEWLILVPVAIVFVAFAIANRQVAGLNFNPFASAPSQQIEVRAPLFLFLFAALAFGVLLGGIFTWFNQRKHRRALRQARSEMERLRADVERLKA